MSQQPFGEYLATKDSAIHSQLIAMFNAKWMNPLCTIDTTKKGIALRFMSAEDHSDPLGVLRFGASTMGTWDIPFDSKIKPADITSYVKEAAKNHQNREK